MSWNLKYSDDFFFTPRYIQVEDLNYNAHVRDQIVNTFYKKVVKWLKGESFEKIFSFFTISGGTADLIKNLKERESLQSRKLTEENKKIIRAHILDFYLTKEFLAKVLDFFRLNNNINWYDLGDHKTDVKKYLRHKLKKRLINEIDHMKKVRP